MMGGVSGPERKEREQEREKDDDDGNQNDQQSPALQLRHVFRNRHGFALLLNCSLLVSQHLGVLFKVRPL